MRRRVRVRFGFTCKGVRVVVIDDGDVLDPPGFARAYCLRWTQAGQARAVLSLASPASSTAVAGVLVTARDGARHALVIAYDAELIPIAHTASGEHPERRAIPGSSGKPWGKSP